MKKEILCLHEEMRFAPQKVCRVLLACAVLHNITLHFRKPDVDDAQEVQDEVRDRQVDDDDGRRLLKIFFFNCYPYF